MRSEFEAKMAEGVALQSHGLHQEALSVRFEAFHLADSPLETARAQRDISASFRGMGEVGRAVELAEASLATLDSIKVANVRDARRELAASQMWVGTLDVEQAVSIERAERRVSTLAYRGLGYFRQAVGQIEIVEEELGGSLDQYEINMLGRSSITESLYGELETGWRQARRAVLLAPYSESGATTTFNLGMPISQRLLARRNALARGGAAMAVAGSISVGARGLALNIANRSM